MSLERISSRTGKAIEEEPRVEKTYRLESGVTVELACKPFEAKESAADASTVVFLPGWGMDAESGPIRSLAQAFADEAHADTLSITTRSQERGSPLTGEEPDLLYEEARSIAAFVRERALKEIIIAGHSQGGDKAIDLATILQKDSTVMVKGLILLDSVGLYAHTPMKLAVKFAADGMRDTANPIESLNAGAEILKTEVKELVRSGRAFPSRFSSEVSEMARQNPHTHDITVPVVVISGANDLISSPKEIVPGESGRRVVGTLEGERDVTLAAREAVLKETLFPNSPYIRMLAPEKAGSHALPLHRPEDVAAAGLYLLERYEREK